MIRPLTPSVAALAGGLLWVLFAVLGGAGLVAETLHFMGWLLILWAAAVFGASLIRAGGTAQRIFVAVASAGFIFLAVEAFRSGDMPWYDGIWGAVLAVLGGVALLRAVGRSPEPDSPESIGPESTAEYP